MFEIFYPGNYVDSAYEIPYEKLYERGYRGIIFDVDNTLVPHGAPADKRAIELFERLRAIGFSTCILSNNKEPRVSPFADKVGSPYIFKGGKPSRKGYERAMERMKRTVIPLFLSATSCLRTSGAQTGQASIRSL